MSDHDAVYMIKKIRVSNSHKLPPKILNVRNFRKFDQVAFQLDMDKIPTEQINSVSKDVNDILNKHACIDKVKYDCREQ